jgi:hypothetical protein
MSDLELYFRDLKPGEWFRGKYLRKRGTCMKTLAVNDMGAGALNAVNTDGEPLLFTEWAPVERVVVTFDVPQEPECADACPAELEARIEAHKEGADLAVGYLNGRIDKLQSAIDSLDDVLGGRVFELTERIDKFQETIDKTELTMDQLGAANQLEANRVNIAWLIGVVREHCDQLSDLRSSGESDRNEYRHEIAELTKRLLRCESRRV